MTDSTRRQILDRLWRLSELAPEIRFGQLVANLATMAEGPWDQTLWNLEDEKLLGAAGQLVADFERRHPSAA
jgi:hypothetical protein